MVVVDVGANGTVSVYFYGGVVGDIIFVFPGIPIGVQWPTWDDVGADGVDIPGVICGDGIGGNDGSVVEEVL